MSTSVLVTGGAGFIGSHTVRLLARSGYNVIVLDNLSTGSPSRIPGDVELVVGDVADKESVKRVIRGRGVEGVIHLAAVVSVDEARQDPRRAYRVNVEGTLNLLEESLKAGVERFVYASSCAVYGNPSRVPVGEDSTLKPTNTYGASKLAGEALVNAYNEEHGLSTVSLRYFNVYGPGMHGGPYAGVIHKFITAALKGKPLKIYGDGEQTRDFVYVEDVAEANLKALQARVTGAYNIGTGKAVTINELARIILEVTRSESGIVYTAPRSGDIKKSQADITLAIEKLGWKARTMLEDGILLTIHSIKKRIQFNIY